MREQLKNLTGLRFIAALLVFGHHSNWNNSGILIKKFFEAGYVGVSFFFVLSGFIISYAYQNRLIKKQVTNRNYLLRRVLRLWPLHILTALPWLYIKLTGSSVTLNSGISYLINISFLQSFVPSSFYYFSLNAASWSLSNEMFFYLVFLLIVPLTERGVRRVFLALIAIITFSALIVTIMGDEYVFLGDKPFSHWLFYIFPVFRLVEFLGGVLLYRFYVKDVQIKTWIQIPVFTLLILAMIVSEYIPVSFRYSLYFLPFIILLLVAHLSMKSWLDRLLGSKIFVLLGNASFAFYLIHKLVIALLYKFGFFESLGDFVRFALSAFVTSLISIVVYLAIEKKINNYLQDLFKLK